MIMTLTVDSGSYRWTKDRNTACVSGGEQKPPTQSHKCVNVACGELPNTSTEEWSFQFQGTGLSL